LLALLIFVFAEPMTMIWPWPIEPLDLRVFTAQVAIVGWSGFAVLRGELLWRDNRLFLVLVGTIGLFQVLGLLLGTVAYNWSSLIGIVLPLMFLEWVMTPLLMFVAQRWR
jgi:hypothetical protein